MSHQQKYAALFFAIMLPGIIAAQPGSIQFNHLTIEDGLSQSTVQSILQDNQGYMWFGTQDGLNHYNGYDITVYRDDVQDSTTIKGNDIRVIYEDSDDRLWIGTQTGGLNLYDRNKDQFLHYRAIDEDWWTLSADAVWDVLEDSYDTFWVGTSYGLNIMNRETGRGLRIFSDSENPKTLTDNQITILFEDSNRDLWVGTANGLNKFNRNDSTFTRYLYSSENRRESASFYINTIYEDSKGNFWVGTEENGLLLFDRENGTYHNYTYNVDNPQGISDNSVIAILESIDGDLWVGTGNRGLNLLDTETFTFKKYNHESQNPQSLSNDGINYVYRSNEGFLWIGTFAGGVSYVDPSPPLFRHFQNEPMNPNSLSNNVVQSFFQDRNGDIWIGTDGGGLNLFDPETGNFKHYRHVPGNSNSISGDVILDIYQNDMGLWLATYGGGVTLFDTRENSFRTFRQTTENTEGLSSDFVFVITPADDGMLWFGTNLGGLTAFNPVTERFEWYLADPNQPNKPETIANNDIRSIFKDSEGDMWMGAYGSVLNRYDTDEGRFYLYDINTNSDLFASVVQDIYEDSKGRLWLATRGGGLKQFMQKTHQIITYTEDDGLSSNIVHAIEEDEFGILWLSTNGGISKFDPQNKMFETYGIENGIQSREFNPSSSLRDREGNIYFGGVNGFNRFHPRDVQTDSTVAPVVLTDLHLFNKSVAVGEDSPLQKQISQTSRLTLGHDASVITFEYAALDFSAQKGNQFAYMMEGFDEDWNYVEDIRRATYTNLSPGEYTFRVKAANRDGVWNEEGVSIAVVIRPPFWQTAWFIVLVLLAIAGTAYLVYWLRVRSIRNRNRMLARVIAKRTNELQKANSTKDKLFSIIAHDLINISTGLSGLSGLMKESLEQENMDEVKEYSGHLHNTIGQFAIMLKNMLDWARSQTGKIQYDPMNFILADIVDEIIEQQESRAIYKSIKLSSLVDKNLEVYADPDMILVILRNLIANALKFTPEGGKIEITAAEEMDAVKVSVHDNGIGMSEEMVYKIFNQDESVTTLGTSNEKGTGLGISLCKDFIRRNKGKLSAESEPGVGTTISFTLPFAQEMESYPGMMTQAS